jgi:DNA repair exonuclease SbcCD ATPase subunit
LTTLQSDFEGRGEALYCQQRLVEARDESLAAAERVCDELRAELEAARREVASTVGAAVGAAARPVAMPVDPAVATDAFEEERNALQQAVADAREQLESAQAVRQRAERALEAEKRRVEELTRERALQLHALKALEQQLEMARDAGRVANG